MDNNKNRVDLSLDELDMVTGGVIPSAHKSGTNSQDKSESFEKHECKGKCKKKIEFRMYSGGRGVCTVCGWPLQ